MEAKGIVADRCELNRQIKKDNALIRTLKKAIKKLTDTLQDTLPSVADALETMRQTVILLCYHINQASRDSRKLKDHLQLYRSKLSAYSAIVRKIKEKSNERKAVQKEKQETPVWKFQHNKKLAAHIASLTEEIEDLQSERKMLLENMNCTDASQIPEIKKKADDLERRTRAINQKTESLKQQRDSVLDQHKDVSADAHSRFAPLELFKARQEKRHDKEDEIKDKLLDYYGMDYSLYVLSQSMQETRELLGEEEEERRLARELREQEKEQRRQETPQKNNRKWDDQER